MGVWGIVNGRSFEVRGPDIRKKGKIKRLLAANGIKMHGWFLTLGEGATFWIHRRDAHRALRILENNGISIY